MLETIWKKLKENYAVLIAIVTAVLTIVYAFLRLCVYIYWSGYFTQLNIDNSVMNLNFDENIFQVIFWAIIAFVILYIMVWVDELLAKLVKKIKQIEVKGKEKIISIINYIVIDVIISFLLLSIVNIPVSFLVCVLGQTELSFWKLCFLLVLFYILEILFLLVQRFGIKETSSKKRSLEEKIGWGSLVVLAYISFFLAGVYYWGNCALDQKNKISLVEDETYAITYCDGENYVLHEAEYIDGKIVIYRNHQKIISVENCEYVVKAVKEVKIID